MHLLTTTTRGGPRSSSTPMCAHSVTPEQMLWCVTALYHALMCMPETNNLFQEDYNLCDVNTLVAEHSSFFNSVSWTSSHLGKYTVCAHKV